MTVVTPAATPAAAPMAAPHANIGRSAIYRKTDQPYLGDSPAIITGVGTIDDKRVDMTVFPQRGSPFFVKNVQYEDAITEKAKRPRRSWFYKA